MLRAYWNIINQTLDILKQLDTSFQEEVILGSQTIHIS